MIGHYAYPVDGYPDGFAMLACETCTATWVGMTGEPCSWCLDRLQQSHDELVADMPRSNLSDWELRPDGPNVRDRMLSLADIDLLPPPAPLVGDLIDLDSIVLAYGRRGSGKSFVAVDLIASITTGTRWHGRSIAHRPAVYVVAEGVAGIGQRFAAWFGAHPTQARPGPDRLLVLPEPVNLLSPSSVGLFAQACAEQGAGLIILDTLARCMVGGDENSAKDAGLAIEQLDVIRRATGACVVAVHHSGKSADAGARGSSAFEAAADTVLEIGTADGITTILCTKQKNHAQPNPIRLVMRPISDSVALADYHADTDELPDSVLATLRALADSDVGAGLAATAWQAVSGVIVPTFYRHRKRLVTLGLVSNVGTGNQPRYQVTDTGAIALSPELSDGQ